MPIYQSRNWLSLLQVHLECNLFVQYPSIIVDEVNGLVKVLVQFNFDHEASKLQQTFGSFLRVIDISIPSIWLDESEEGEESVVSYFLDVLVKMTLKSYVRHTVLLLEFFSCRTNWLIWPYFLCINQGLISNKSTRLMVEISKYLPLWYF